ncbi:MAG: 16S rRNA (guanine(527)-N(7))-methyltransferase RsmG [Clostridia bacterium]|nr:16S rRNA (guanine(527)-N(7))-methyltransferase RsmG [Clostridia bacterium]
MTEFQKELIRVAQMNEATKDLISEEKAQLLEMLRDRLVETNKTLNLTSILDDEGIILKHLVDSSACVPFVPRDAKVCDIGCGGGFPSLVISILRDDVSVFAVDSVTKKVNYVKETGKLFNLKLDTSSRRAEELGKDKLYRESFDIVTARAVGRLNLLCELCLPLVSVGGAFISMKAQTTGEELKEAENAIALLGGKVERVYNYTLTNGSESLERAIVVIRKVNKTPLNYPRNNSQISKKPL